MQNIFSIPISIEDIGNNQKNFNIDANAEQLQEITEILKVDDVKSYKANIYLKLYKKEHLLKVWGEVDSVIEHTSVISLEKFEKSYHVDFEDAYDTKATPKEIKELELELDFNDNSPSYILDGQIDIAAIGLEQLSLILDDNPRKDDEVFNFQSEFDEETTIKTNPFSVLMNLKK